MAYRNNAFCWHGIISTDVGAVKDFYPKALGWTVQEMQMGDETATMFVVDGIPRAHLRGPNMGEPSAWNNYLRVEDVDATTALAVENGGRQLVEPTDIPPGRFSVIASPTGAVFSLFHEADPNAENAPSGPGSIHWVELHSTAIETDLQWLKSTFGYTTGEMPMPNGTYYLLNDGDAPCGGAMQTMNPQAPSHWLAWVEVENIGDSCGLVTESGGVVHMAGMEVEGVGKMAVVADPSGGAFGIIQPAAR